MPSSKQAFTEMIPIGSPHTQHWATKHLLKKAESLTVPLGYQVGADHEQERKHQGHRGNGKLLPYVEGRVGSLTPILESAVGDQRYLLTD